MLTTPALRLLNQSRPDLQISVVVEKAFEPVFEGNPAVVEVLPPSATAIRSWKPDLCLNLHGGTRSQWITTLSGARWRAGFAHHSFAFTYNVKIGGAQEIIGVKRKVHTAEHLAAAVFALGVPVQRVPPAQLFTTQSSAKGRYAVLHAFASAPEKRWPADRFCEVARYLKLWNITPIFLAGKDDDATCFEPHQVFRGSLAELKALLSKAAVFVGNDSGPAHMAAAFLVPSVVLFGTSDPKIWRPWRTEAQVIAAPHGLGEVSVSRVIAALERLHMLEEAHA